MNGPFKTHLKYSKPRHVNMQHGGLAVIERREAAVDGGRKLVRLGDAFAVGAEGFRDAEKSRRSPWRPDISRDWNWSVSAAMPLG